MNTKYNYVFFALDKDYYRVAYYDIQKCSYAKIKWSGSEFSSSFFNLLHKLHYSSSINKYVSLPFKRIWFPFLSKSQFKNDKPLCFVFFGREAKKYGTDFMRYLKKNYSGSKIVITFLDLIKITLSDAELVELRKHTDLIFTYDFGDAQKYDMVYQHDVFSKYPVNNNPEIPKKDIYFLGKAKDRLTEIIKCYDLLTYKGLICDFYISGVNPDDRIHRNGIHYIENNITYLENLQHVCASKALLEIIQGGAQGSTLRCCEAIAYGKVLITNNAGILNEPFYNDRVVKLFSSVDDLDLLDSRSIKTKADFDFIDNLSPLAFIDRLEMML